jgi:hypothetical protein
MWLRHTYPNIDRTIILRSFVNTIPGMVFAKLLTTFLRPITRVINTFLRLLFVVFIKDYYCKRFVNPNSQALNYVSSVNKGLYYKTLRINDLEKIDSLVLDLNICCSIFLQIKKQHPSPLLFK